MASILITGDFFVGTPATESPEDFFGDFLPEIRKANLAITNFEAPVAEGGKSINKTGPALAHSRSALRLLSKAGFGLVTLANNHIMDFGDTGLEQTLSACGDFSMPFTGAGNKPGQACTPFFTTIENKRIAIINVSENEFATATPERGGAHPLDPIDNYRQIREAKSKADFVLVIVHGGHEMYQLPSPRMQSTYRFFVDAGADAVVGHHPHCVSGYEIYRERHIFYSLGNFLFKWNGSREATWYEGIAVAFDIVSNKLVPKIIPTVQHKSLPKISRMDSQREKLFLSALGSLNKVIGDQNELKKAFDDYCKNVRKAYASYLEPHSSRLLQIFQSRKLLPSFLKKRKKTLMLNLIRCEAHRDVVINLLKDDTGYSSK